MNPYWLLGGAAALLLYVMLHQPGQASGQQGSPSGPQQSDSGGSGGSEPTGSKYIPASIVYTPPGTTNATPTSTPNAATGGQTINPAVLAYAHQHFQMPAHAGYALAYRSTPPPSGYAIGYEQGRLNPPPAQFNYQAASVPTVTSSDHVLPVMVGGGGRVVM